MKSKLIPIAVAAMLLSTVVGGCGRAVIRETVATQPPLPVTVLAKQGFRAGPPLFAAPSLVDLLGLIHGVGVYPDFDECQRFQDLRPSCWSDVKDPGNSLVIAALVDEPCMVTNSINAVLVSTAEVGVTVVNSGGCVSGMPPLPNLSLIAIPLNVLPATEITVSLQHPGIPAHSAKFMVDLRQPLDVHADIQARITEVRASIGAAEKDALNQLPPGQAVSFLAIGTNRWTDTSLGCPFQGRAAQAADARGFVVFLRASDQPQMALEYHISGATLAFCGRVAS